VAFEAPGRVGISSYPDPQLRAHEIRLETIYSGISAGTELTAYRGSNPYLSKQWDQERRIFLEEHATFTYPIEGWGYEEVGRVVEKGTAVTAVSEGDVVWGAWGHRSTHVMPEQEAAVRLLEPSVDPINGVFSQIGAIALNSVLDADIHVGETVAVFGQGVPGLIAGQLARINGASVIAIDRITNRLELSTRLGADHAIPALGAAERIKELTGGRGADVCIELSGFYPALQEAIRAVAYNSRVVASGFFQGGGAALFLGEEFHHNRVEVVCSQISGVSRRLDHRWSEARLRSTVMALQAAGRLDFKSLVSHVFSFADADKAFELLDKRGAEAVQVVLRLS
jgi:threonine dehydrogenase-like Zn-dependent dehydrogenase